MKNTFFCLSLMFLMAYTAKTQSTLIGNMTDWEGEILIGYPVMIEGTTYGTVSDENGFYRLEYEGVIEAVKSSSDWNGSIRFYPGSTPKVDIIMIDENWINDKLTRREIEKRRKDFSPSIQVKGQLLDESQRPIANARMHVDGFDESYTTDSEGRYELTVPFGVIDILIYHEDKSKARVEYYFKVKKGFPQTWSKKVARLWGLPY